MDEKKCLKCQYSWKARKEFPKECPACKSRSWSPREDDKDENNGNGKTQ